MTPLDDKTKALISIALMGDDPDPWVCVNRFHQCREIAMKALDWSVMPERDGDDRSDKS